MEIIKEGRKQKGWSKEFECTGKGNGDGGCNATLLVSEEDCYMTYNHTYDEKEEYVTFKCPCCEVETDIDNKDISNIIKRRIRSRYEAKKNNCDK